MIPAGPPSPNGKKSKDAELIADAQKLHVMLQHQRKSGYGVHATTSLLEGIDADDHETAEELKKRKNLEAKAVERKEASEKKKKDASNEKAAQEARQFDIEPQPELPAQSLSNFSSPLTTVLEVGQGIVIRNIPNSGRGLVSTIPIRKSQYICNYDGNRVDATSGKVLMYCNRTRDAVLHLPPQVQEKLRALQYSKTWAVTVNRGSNITKFGGGRDVVIDGTIAASHLLDIVVNRGLIGPGSVMNSSQKTGIPANCILIFIPWHESCYSTANFFVPTGSEKMMAVLVAKFDILPNTHLTWDYSYASHALSSVPSNTDIGAAPGYVAVVRPPVSEIPCRSCDAENQDAVEVEAVVLDTAEAEEVFTPVAPMTLMEERIRNSVLMKSKDLKAFVKLVMDFTPCPVPVEFRLTNISNRYTYEELQVWCAAQAQRMESARIKRFKVTLSARDSVEACMRMLALFSNDQYMQELYLNSRSLPTQSTMDAKAVGDEHPFWTELHKRFHSSDYALPFPWDYIPSSFKVTTSQGIVSEYAPPKSVETGFLKGLELLHARKPAMYAEYFFNKNKLQELWKKSLADYRYLLLFSIYYV